MTSKPCLLLTPVFVLGVFSASTSSAAETPATQENSATESEDGTCCQTPTGRAQLIAAFASDTDISSTEISVAPQKTAAPDGMVWIPGGEFTMGSNDHGSWRNEQPAHRVQLDGFWMDETEVTNAQFAAFVQATGYVTIAEREVDWEAMKKQMPPGTPKPPAEMLAPGAIVFTPPNHPVSLQNNVGAWWSLVLGASWREPTGPGSSIEGKDDYPVVHIAWHDAKAYADWAGKSLPTEAQWEYAAKGGRDDTRFAWGNTFRPDGQIMANTWDGKFPYLNTKDDGYERSAPVKTYPPNGYGLYDTAGNVWEWTADLYRDDRHVQLAEELAEQGFVHNPTGPDEAVDAANRGGTSRVMKGGSYLCHVDYCESYRPSARRGTPPDTGLQHTGFRCVINLAASD